MNASQNSIMSTISSIFSSLFSSIDSSLYSALDSISFIDTSILTSPYFEKIFGTSSSSGILMIANSLLIGFILYYIAKHILSNFSIGHSQNPYQFLIKIILIGICMNGSFFLCEQIININSLLSASIREIGKNFLHTDICFSNLINILNSIVIIEEDIQTFFSIDGIIKTIVSVSFINLIFIYSIRYVLLKVLVLISPFAILSLSTPSSSNFFKSWLKSLLSLLFLETFSSLILIVMFSIEYSPSDLVSKILFVGSVFALMRVNSYVRDILGGINIDVQNSMYALRGISKIH